MICSTVWAYSRSSAPRGTRLGGAMGSGTDVHRHTPEPDPSGNSTVAERISSWVPVLVHLDAAPCDTRAALRTGAARVAGQVAGAGGAQAQTCSSCVTTVQQGQPGTSVEYNPPQRQNESRQCNRPDGKNPDHPGDCRYFPYTDKPCVDFETDSSSVRKEAACYFSVAHSLPRRWRPSKIAVPTPCPQRHRRHAQEQAHGRRDGE